MMKQLIGLAGLSLVLVLIGCDQRVDDDGQPQRVEVVYRGQAVAIDLGLLATVEVAGRDQVRLSEVVEAADLGLGLEYLSIDFLAADGFRPTDSPYCTDEIVPLPGPDLEQGYIDPLTRDLFWEEALGLPGCVRVNDVAQILVSDVPTPSG